MVRAAKVGNWIRAGGEIIPVLPSKGVRFSLEEVQKMVGGFVERVRLLERAVMLVNEEGIPLRLPFNRLASEMVGTDIFGDVVVLPRGMGW